MIYPQSQFLKGFWIEQSSVYTLLCTHKGLAETVVGFAAENVLKTPKDVSPSLCSTSGLVQGSQGGMPASLNATKLQFYDP